MVARQDHLEANRVTIARMAIDFQEIGARLRGARESRGWSQAQVARKVGVTAQAVSLVEQGKVKAPETIEAVAVAVGCPFVFYVGVPDDQVSRLLTRLARELPQLQPGVVATLDALVTVWERENAARSRTG